MITNRQLLSRYESSEHGHDTNASEALLGNSQQILPSFETVVRRMSSPGRKHHFVLAGSRIPVPAVNCQPSVECLRALGSPLAAESPLAKAVAGPRAAKAIGAGDDPHGDAVALDDDDCAAEAALAGVATPASAATGADDVAGNLQQQLFNRVRAERALRAAKSKADDQRVAAEQVCVACTVGLCATDRVTMYAVSCVEWRAG